MSAILSQAWPSPYGLAACAIFAYSSSLSSSFVNHSYIFFSLVPTNFNVPASTPSGRAGVSHNKNRFSVGRAFLLDSTRICQAQKASSFKIMTIEYLNGINDMDLFTISQLFIGSFSDDRIHMDRIDGFNVRMLGCL